ncbi:HlyD family efflux transporter periplasmic adaptor subunit [Flavobacteriaceae bacterium AU392]|nr:HlyD family efflux transporter periplasmic adaptor subunit [Flavobacteriaceae bacterium]RKM84051.1 HlyD family efflux transporter periplasmic adaptor subunit [Flavobacteriaceae bacterium AU392]
MPENSQHIELRSEEVQEILEATPSWMIRWGNILVLSLIVMLLFISWFVKYPDIIASQALITTIIPPQKEYATINGKIASVLVSDNDTLSSDTPLAILENTANYNDVFLLKSIIDTIAVNNKSFEFPIASIPVLNLGDIQQNYAAFELDFLRYINNKKYRPFSNEENANLISKKELIFRLQVQKAQYESGKAELALQKKDLDRNKDMFSKGLIAAQAYEREEANYIRAESNLTSISNSISQTREAISNANKASKTTTINKSTEEVLLFKTAVQSFNQLKRAIKDWELRYVLQSNIDGKVSFLNTWTVNQTVNQGDLLFTIIPEENSAYIAKLKTPAQNSGKLKVGQRVNIKLQNYPDTEFGTLQGHIESIALFPDEEGLYLVNTSLPKTLITSYKKEIPFKHEMNGSAEIITEDLRLIQRFFSQLKNVFNN